MVPAVEGWFTLDDEPRLLGTRCRESGTYYFPPETTMSSKRSKIGSVGRNAAKNSAPKLVSA